MTVPDSTVPDSNDKTERVLIHTPFGRDGSMISEVLSRARIDGIVCARMDDFLTELSAGAGAVILGDEALDREAVQRLAQILAGQPHWSDLPVLVMTSGGEATDAS